jgi:putative transposase
MPRLQSEPICLTQRERSELQSLVGQQTWPQHLALRVRIVLLADAGVGVRPSAAELGIGRSTVQIWRRRWRSRRGGSLAERLADLPRPGVPPLFSAEQVCAILTLACESPQDSERAITHWTQRELPDEAMKRGIVTCISQRAMGRF